MSNEQRISDGEVGILPPVSDDCYPPDATPLEVLPAVAAPGEETSRD